MPLYENLEPRLAGMLYRNEMAVLYYRALLIWQFYITGPFLYGSSILQGPSYMAVLYCMALLKWQFYITGPFLNGSSILQDSS